MNKGDKKISWDRHQTKTVSIGGLSIGGGNPIAVQSMTNTDTSDQKATLVQIKRLEKAGCQIVRLAVPDIAAARAIKNIKRQVSIPLVADIHFDHRLALESLRSGVDKLRINPGNIGSKEKIRQVVKAAAERNVPIRIGVNAGSLEKDILAKHGRPTAAGLVESAGRHVRILEDLGFTDIVISLKGSEVPMTIEACRLMSRRSKYPLHLGITEAGTAYAGAIRSAVGIGALLAQGIGDTIRVSLSGDPVKEVEAARIILQSLELGAFGPVVLACPTCGRTKIDVEGIATQVEKMVKDVRVPLKIAVMGCAVNGPGEARQADIGIAGGYKGRGLLFKKGRVVEMVDEKMMVKRLLAEINKMSGN